MKKNIIKLMVIISIIFCANITNTFADNLAETTTAENNNKAQDSKEKAYQEKANIIRNEIKTINEEIKAVKSSTNTIKTKYAQVIKNQKNGTNTTITEENLKKAKELRKTITKKGKKENSLDSETSVQTYMENKDYDNALNKLNSNLEKKKEELAYRKAVNEIWKQIDALIN